MYFSAPEDVRACSLIPIPQAPASSPPCIANDVSQDFSEDSINADPESCRHTDISLGLGGLSDPTPSSNCSVSDPSKSFERHVFQNLPVNFYPSLAAQDQIDVPFDNNATDFDFSQLHSLHSNSSYVSFTIIAMTVPHYHCIFSFTASLTNGVDASSTGINSGLLPDSLTSLVFPSNDSFGAFWKDQSLNLASTRTSADVFLDNIPLQVETSNNPQNMDSDEAMDIQLPSSPSPIFEPNEAELTSPDELSLAFPTCLRDLALGFNNSFKGRTETKIMFLWGAIETQLAHTQVSHSEYNKAWNSNN